jgi:hypothetical protein
VVSRIDLGLPEEWGKIEDWLNESKDIVKSYIPDAPPPALKNPEIPKLVNYEQIAPDDFWKFFPLNNNSKLKTSVKIKELQKCWFS